MADCVGFENRCTFAGTEGSNPSLSAIRSIRNPFHLRIRRVVQHQRHWPVVQQLHFHVSPKDAALDGAA